MSNANNNNGPVVPAPAASAAKKKKKTKQKTGAAPAAATSGPAIQQDRTSNRPAEQFTYVFGPRDKAVHDYLKCIFEPDKHSARVPNDAGGFELYTKLWRTKESGTVVAGADGTAALGLCANGWVENANADGTPAPSCSVLGYTENGSASVRSTNPAGVYGEALPVLDSVYDPVFWGLKQLDRPTDTPLLASSRIRLVAMKLAIHGIESADKAKGEVMLAGTVNPAGGIGGGTLNGCTWDTLDKTNDDVVTRASQGIAGWVAGDEFAIVAIPGEAQCFEMVQQQSVGRNAPTAPVQYTPFFHLGLIARGMGPGDSLSYRVTYVWESELAKTNDAEGDSSGMRVVPVPSATLDLVKSKARPYATAANLPGVASLPWVESLAVENPMAAHMLGKHPKLPAALRPVVNRPMLGPVAHVQPEQSWLGKLFNVGKTLNKAVSQTGLLSAIPVAGPIVQGLSSVLASIFD